MHKVTIKDKALWKTYGTQVAVISSAVTLLAFCLPPSSSLRWRITCSAIFILALILIFIGNWYNANHKKRADLSINQTKVHVYIGDLFAQDGLKIIGVNNYIDLVADDVVVSKNTLHGQFIIRYQKEIDEIKKVIKKSKTLIKDECPQHNQRNKPSYANGSCVLYGEYVLAVLTRFDNQNKAVTSIQEYVQFWMSFWKNIDALYNSRTLNIPILGAGQTRFRDEIPAKQELLEIALWTLKESGFHNNYRDKSINFVVYENDAREIDFYRIQKIFE